MRERLMVALEPIRLDVVNESHLHAGHAGLPAPAKAISGCWWCRRVSKAARGSIATGWSTRRSPTCCGKKVHALAIKAYAPGEAIR